MKKSIKKILSIAAGIVFLIFLIMLPRILTQGTVNSVKLAVKLKNLIEKKAEKRLPSTIIEPIEKDGFFHFLPGAKICALEKVDQYPETSALKTPEEIIKEAKNAGAAIISSACLQNASSWDYSLALAKLAKQNNLKNIFSCSGCTENDFFRKIIPFLDALKIELGDTETEYYSKTDPLYFDTVIKNISTARAAGLHLEIAYFINSAGDEKEKEIKTALSELKKNAGPETIIHFLPTPNTEPGEIIKKAREMALQEGFKYVYAGGLEDWESENTYCPDGSLAIRRQSDFLLQNNLVNGTCPDGTTIPGVWY